MDTPPETVEALARARSWLFVPGDKADRLLVNAAASEADALIVDLEDSVAPARKDEARALAGAAILSWSSAKPLVVRINGSTSPWWRSDMEMVSTTGPAALMIPKVDLADLERVSVAWHEHRDTGRKDMLFPALVPLVETASGVLHAEAIAEFPGVVAVALGGEDLAADLRISHTDSGSELDHPRAHLILACAAAGHAAIDSPVLGPRDLDLVKMQTASARRLGFTGKLAIHPRQAPVINAAFQPDDRELSWAHSVIGAFEAASASDSGLAVVNGRMVDAAVVAIARRTLARANR